MSATNQQIAELRHAAHLLFDALDASGVYCERDTGVVDATGAEIAAALLAAGWTPPASQKLGRETPDAVRRIAEADPSEQANRPGGAPMKLEERTITTVKRQIPDILPAPLVGPVLTLLDDDRVPTSLRYAFVETVTEMARAATS